METEDLSIELIVEGMEIYKEPERFCLACSGQLKISSKLLVCIDCLDSDCDKFIEAVSKK